MKTVKIILEIIATIIASVFVSFFIGTLVTIGKFFNFEEYSIISWIFFIMWEIFCISIGLIIYIKEKENDDI